MLINSEEPEVPDPRQMRTDADVISESARCYDFLKKELVPSWQGRCVVSEQKLAEQEDFLSELQEDAKRRNTDLEAEIERVGNLVARLLRTLDFNHRQLNALGKYFMRLSLVLGYVEAMSAGMGLHFRVVAANVDAPPGIRSTDYARWEARREHQLAGPNIWQMCIAELRHIVRTPPPGFQTGH